MLDAEFDQFASEYHLQHAASIRLSGETPDFFAKYKIDDVAAVLASIGKKPERILDFGGGVGNSLGHFRTAFPESEIVLLDPSQQSLDIAGKRFPNQAKLHHFNGEEIPYGENHFDLIFTACVFHHIPENLHIQLLREISRVLVKGGSFFLFEHNPWNPLTLHAVHNCPFDKNAVLIKAKDMKKRLIEAGLPNPNVAYRIFFPRLLARLRALEPYFVKIPAGAQYYVHAIKP